MSLTINTNLEALDASRNLNSTENMLAQSMERLSSGLKINSAADDVAGYAISENLTSQVNGLNQASENIQDAVALTQTAQGALNDVEQMLQRIRELSVEKENGTTSAEGKVAIEEEQEDLLKEIERVAKTTTFNGTELLEGGAEIAFQVGPNEGAEEKIEVKAGEVGTIVTTIGGAAAVTLENVTTAIEEVAKLAGEFGAAQDRIQYTQTNLEVYSQNLTAAQSALDDVNMATEMTNFTKNEVLQQAGVAILAQANQLPDAALKLLE
ncbi:MAG TPA: flagellin [Solirubrobacteraceae bacterium]|nr:flagellin [Solirubrobacteraceae bacterium]